MKAFRAPFIFAVILLVLSGSAAHAQANPGGTTAAAPTPVPSPPLTADAFCNVIMQTWANNQQLARVFTDFTLLEADLIGGAKVPTWNDFNTLKTLILELQKARGSWSGETDLLAQIQDVLTTQYFYNTDFSHVMMNNASDPNWSAGNYKLTKVFRYYLTELNRSFPPGIQFKLNPIPDPIASDEQLTNEGIAMVTRQERRVEETFPRLDPTGKIKSWKDVANTSHAWVTAQGALSIYPSLLATLQNPDLYEVSMHVNYEGLFYLINGEANNLRFSAKGAGGTEGNSYLEEREQFEANAFGFTRPDFAKIPAVVKIKNGLIRFAPEAPFYMDDNAISYGDVILVRRTRQIMNRTTITYGNSLGLDNPAGIYSLFRMNTPLKFIEHVVSGFTVAGDASVVPGKTKLVLSGKLAAFPDSPLTYDPSYLEDQEVGPSPLSEYKKAIFTQRMPNDEMVAALLANNVEIWDGRANLYAPTRWDPNLQNRAGIHATDGPAKTPLVLPRQNNPMTVKAPALTPKDLKTIFPGLRKPDVKMAMGMGMIQSSTLKTKKEFSMLIPTNTFPPNGAASFYPITQDPNFYSDGSDPTYTLTPGMTANSVALVDFVSANPWSFGNGLYRFAEDANEVAQWNGPHTFTKPVTWISSMQELFKMRGVRTGQTRSILRGETSIVVSNMYSYSATMKAQAATGDIQMALYMDPAIVNQFQITGQLVDPQFPNEWNANPLSGTSALQLKISPAISLTTSASVDGSALYTLVSEVQGHLQNSIYWMQNLPPPTIPPAGAVSAMNAEIQHLSAEMNLLQYLAAKSPVADVQNMLNAMLALPGDCFVDRFDTEKLVDLANEYIKNGKL